MSPGTCAILNCTDGDTRISFNSDDPGEVERAKMIVEDMLRRGFCIAVTVGEKMERAIGFDAKAGEYIVTDSGPKANPTTMEDPLGECKDIVLHEAKGRKGNGHQRIPAKSARATAVGRTAGGALGFFHFGVTREMIAAARRGNPDQRS